MMKGPSVIGLLLVLVLVLVLAVSRFRSGSSAAWCWMAAGTSRRWPARARPGRKTVRADENDLKDIANAAAWPRIK
jgi:hypothetical protein